MPSALPTTGLRGALRRLVRTATHGVYCACFKWNPLGPALRRCWFRVSLLLLRVQELGDRWGDRRYGVDTAGIVPAKPGTTQEGDAMAYQATPYVWLEQMLATVPMGPEDVFVDIGCGKGRVALLVAARALRKVIGLDVVPELVDAARQNALRVHLPTPVEFLQADAATFDVREGTIFYLFNPFGAPTMTRVLENIARSLAQHPRPIHIIYVYPLHAALLDGQPWLTLEQDYPGIMRIWRSVEAPDAGRQGQG